MFQRYVVALSSAAALVLVTATPAYAQGGTHVPRWSVGMAASIAHFSPEEGDGLTTFSLPGGGSPFGTITSIALGNGSTALWVDYNATDNWQIEFPLGYSYSKVKGDDDAFTMLRIGVEPHYYFGHSLQSTRFFVGGGGIFDRLSVGESATQWSLRGVAGLEFPLMNDLRLRTDVFYQRYFENEDDGLVSLNAFGWELGANCYFGDEDDDDGDDFAPFNLRVGTDFSFDRVKDIDDLNTTTFSLPSFYVGGFVPLSHSEQFQLGGEVAFQRIQSGGESLNEWQWRPTLEYNLMPGYLKQTGVRLQGGVALRHIGISAGDVSGTQFGFGGGAAVTFPMLGHLGSVGADWTHFQDQDDLATPSSNQFRIKFEMTHRVHF